MNDFKKCKECKYIDAPIIVKCERCDNNILFEKKDIVKKFKVYINATNPYEVAVVNLNSDSLVFRCTGGTESEKIEGFFAGLRYCGYEYHKTKNLKINPDNELFEKYGFSDCSNYTGFHNAE